MHLQGSTPTTFLNGSYYFFECFFNDRLWSNSLLKFTSQDTSLAVQWLGLCASTIAGTGLIPDWGTNSCLPRGTAKKKKSRIQCFNIFTEYHHHAIPEHFITPKRNPIPISHHSSFLLPNSP